LALALKTVGELAYDNLEDIFLFYFFIFCSPRPGIEPGIGIFEAFMGDMGTPHFSTLRRCGVEPVLPQLLPLS
jgi:hypothetical protein